MAEVLKIRHETTRTNVELYPTGTYTGITLGCCGRFENISLSPEELLQLKKFVDSRIQKLVEQGQINREDAITG
jgi:hypothetical protein